MNRSDDRLRLYFTMTGDWDPEKVTSRLGIEPSLSWKIGDPKSIGRGAYEFSRWVLDSGLPPTATFGEHLQELLNRLRPLTKKIAELAPGNYPTVVLAAHYSDWQPGLVFEPDQVQELADLGVALDLDLYFDGPEEDA